MPLDLPPACLYLAISYLCLPCLPQQSTRPFRHHTMILLHWYWIHKMHPPGNQQPSPQRRFLAVLLTSLTIKFKAGSLRDPWEPLPQTATEILADILIVQCLTLASSSHLLLFFSHLLLPPNLLDQFFLGKAAFFLWSKGSNKYL